MKVKVPIWYCTQVKIIIIWLPLSLSNLITTWYSRSLWRIWNLLCPFCWVASSEVVWIEAKNRCLRVEWATGKQVSFSMRYLYTDGSMILEHLLMFSQRNSGVRKSFSQPTSKSIWDGGGISKPSQTQTWVAKLGPSDACFLTRINNHKWHWVALIESW